MLEHSTDLLVRVRCTAVVARLHARSGWWTMSLNAMESHRERRPYAYFMCYLSECGYID